MDRKMERVEDGERKSDRLEKIETIDRSQQLITMHAVVNSLSRFVLRNFV